MLLSCCVNTRCSSERQIHWTALECSSPVLNPPHLVCLCSPAWCLLSYSHHINVPVPASISEYYSPWHPPGIVSFPLAQNPLFTSFCLLSYPEWSLLYISLDYSVWWELWTYIHCFPYGHGLLSLQFTQGITCYEFVFFILFFIFIENRFFSLTIHPDQFPLHPLLQAHFNLPSPIPLHFLFRKGKASKRQQPNRPKQNKIKTKALLLRLDKVTQYEKKKKSQEKAKESEKHMGSQRLEL